MSATTEPPKPPSSPARLLLWAGVFAVTAALGFAVLVPDWQRVTDFDLYGQRSFGVVFFTPFIAATLTVLLAVLGVRAIGRAQRYDAQWTAQQRERAVQRQLAGQPSTPFIVFGVVLAVIWLAGSVAVAIFLGSLVTRPDSLALALMLLVPLGASSVAIIGAGLRRRRAGSPSP